VRIVVHENLNFLDEKVKIKPLQANGKDVSRKDANLPAGRE
jgi:hypothetical protein